MPKIRILTESELRRAVALDVAAVDCIESAFRTLAGGKVVMPPILSMAIAEHNGEVDVKTAYVPGLECFAIKVSPGFFDNPKLGLPSLNGLMILFSARTGNIYTAAGLVQWVRWALRKNDMPVAAWHEAGRFLPADVWQDVRYGGRALRRSPGLASAAIGTLAVGIGVTAAMYAIVDAVLLHLRRQLRTISTGSVMAA